MKHLLSYSCDMYCEKEGVLYPLFQPTQKQASQKGAFTSHLNSIKSLGFDGLILRKNRKEEKSKNLQNKDLNTLDELTLAAKQIDFELFFELEEPLKNLQNNFEHSLFVESKIANQELEQELITSLELQYEKVLQDFESYQKLGLPLIYSLHIDSFESMPKQVKQLKHLSYKASKKSMIAFEASYQGKKHPFWRAFKSQEEKERLPFMVYLKPLFFQETKELQYPVVPLDTLEARLRANRLNLEGSIIECSSLALQQGFSQHSFKLFDRDFLSEPSVEELLETWLEQEHPEWVQHNQWLRQAYYQYNHLDHAEKSFCIKDSKIPIDFKCFLES